MGQAEPETRPLPVPGSQVELPLIRRFKENIHMPATLRFLAMAVGLAIAVTGCATPPAADVDAAKVALDKAVTDRADQYAAESLKAAQDARTALDVELKAQEANWFKSYDKTKELAAAAKAAAEKAAVEPLPGQASRRRLLRPRKADGRAKARVRRRGPRWRERQGANEDQGRPPVYPPTAQSARVAGAVILEATIGPDGKVIDAKVVRSVPMLDQAALDAVRQWEYTPTLLNGAPVPVRHNGHGQLQAVAGLRALVAVARMWKAPSGSEPEMEALPHLPTGFDCGMPEPTVTPAPSGGGRGEASACATP